MSVSQTQRQTIRGMLADLKMPGSLEAVDAVKGRRIFPSHGRSDFPTRLRCVVVV